MRIVLALLSLALWGSAFAQSPSPQALAVKPLVDEWRNCAMEKARKFISSGEPAETIAKAAIYECRDKREIAHQAMLSVKMPATDMTLDRLQVEFQDFLVSLVVQAKSK